MSLRYKLRKARSLLATLSADDRDKLANICKDIRQSQKTLLENAGAAMQQCLHNCEGLCCRNARVDDIIGLWDLVYILTLTPEREEDMAARVVHEKPFYSADCMFLKEDTGPCIFTSAIRPEVCITTFCSGDGSIQKEIRSVKRQFFRLNWFFFCRKPHAILSALQHFLKTRERRTHRSPPTDMPERRMEIDGRQRGENNG